MRRLKRRLCDIRTTYLLSWGHDWLESKTTLAFVGNNNFIHFKVNSFYLFFIYNFSLFLDEANYKKFDEHAPRNSQSSNANKNQSEAVNQAKANNGKATKRSNLKKRSDKTNYSHNWLLTTLKGHTGSVLDMSFSSNGKYLATCADGELLKISFPLEILT